MSKTMNTGAAVIWSVTISADDHVSQMRVDPALDAVQVCRNWLASLGMGHGFHVVSTGRGVLEARRAGRTVATFVDPSLASAEELAYRSL